MKQLFLLCILIIATKAWGNLHLAPPDFDTPSGRAVFIDMTNAHHDIVFDGFKRQATATSTIRFEQKSRGLPIFDLVPEPSSVKIDGEEVAQTLTMLPDNGSQVRVVQKLLAPGTYTLTVTNRISENVRFSPFRNVSAAFWIRDLKARMFWEQYLPVNLEFDQHPRSMDLSFKGRKVHNQVIHANGTVTKTGTNKWRIEYPAWYTVSAPYFHTMRKGARRTLYFTLKSIDGREIPATVYTFFPWSVKKYAEEMKRVFVELENDYGPWPHDVSIAYGAGLGGMEHSGATMTSFAALDHEMLHSYFAKGVLPVNGNAGWIDEAIASWRDYGYFRSAVPGVPANLAGRGPYARNTNSQAYEYGRNFLGYLDYLMQDMGGLKAFLRGYFQNYKYTLVTTEHFINNLEFFTGMDLKELFQENVFTPTPGRKSHSHDAFNPNHPEVSPELLKSRL
ncbi:MAG: hypothetical protein ACLGG7_08000 [Bacteriovoracia bacterium]